MNTQHVQTWQRLRDQQQRNGYGFKWLRRAFRRLTGYYPQADSFGHLYAVKK
jgi:hypothetical protein